MNVIGKLFDGECLCISCSAELVASIKQANKNRIRENKKIKECIQWVEQCRVITNSQEVPSRMARCHVYIQNIFGLGKLKEAHKIVLQQWVGKFPPWVIKYYREESRVETAYFQAKSLMCLQLGAKGNLWPFFSL